MITRRGIVVLYAATALLSTTAGATAQKWDPITRQLDRCARSEARSTAHPAPAYPFSPRGPQNAVPVPC